MCMLMLVGEMDLGLTAFSFHIIFLSKKKGKRCERKTTDKLESKIMDLST